MALQIVGRYGWIVNRKHPPRSRKGTLHEPGPPRAGRGRRQERELAILNTIAEALNSAPDVRQALERTLGLVAELLDLGTGWIWLLDPETNQFYSAAVRNLPPYLQDPVRMAGRKCWCIEDFREGKLTPKNIDVMECSRLRPAVEANDLEATRGLACHASIPLYFGDKPLGIMNVTGPAWRKLTREELRLLSTIAYQVGVAVERARLAERDTVLARVEERTRIAREIHDTLAQGLTAIALQIEGAVHRLDRGDLERARERLARALETAQANLEEARRSVDDLRAAPLAGKSLAQALRDLGRSFTSETGVRASVEADEALLPLRLEGELYRIAQEALANVRRHASAAEVRIRFAANPESVRLSIRDDGRGFESAAVPHGRFGLVGMHERARLVGGRLRIRSRPDEGTTVSASVPRMREEARG